jgi:diaminopimelate epimerase
MQIKFQKWQACLNDFVLFQVGNDPLLIQALVNESKRLCKRDGGGIGADGIIIIETIQGQPETTPAKVTIINSDGSFANTCGNGLRSVAASLFNGIKESRSRDLPEYIELELPKNNVICRILTQRGSESFVAVDMSSVRLGTLVEEAKKELDRAQTTLQLPKLKAEIGTCDIGNQHIVIFHQDPLDIVRCRQIGHFLQTSNYWDGINVHFCHRLDPSVKDNDLAKKVVGGEIEDLYQTFVWERGAGPTKACGSGACAIAALSYDMQATSRSSWVAVDMPGGRLYAKQDDEDSNVILAGPAVPVFSGIIEI